MRNREIEERERVDTASTSYPLESVKSLTV